MEHNGLDQLKIEGLVTISEMLANWKSEWGVDAPSRSTVERWRKTGCRGKKLETVLLKNQRYTSLAAVKRFINEINGIALNVPEIKTEKMSIKPKRMSRQEMNDLMKKHRFVK